MKGKPLNNGSSSHKTLISFKRNQLITDKVNPLSFQGQISKNSSKRKIQKSGLSIKTSTPSLKSNMSIKNEKRQKVNKKPPKGNIIDSTPNKHSQRGTQMEEIIHLNNQHIQSQTTPEYQDPSTLRLNSYSNLFNRTKRNSLIYEEFFDQYGYSNLSYVNNHSQKLIKDPQSTHPNTYQKQQIQKLINKYKKNLDYNDHQKQPSKSSNQNFRTLSTDDKSEKLLSLKSKLKKTHKNIQTKNSIQPLQIKPKNNSKNKACSDKKKKVTKTILPQYFGCLSINQIQSQIQKVKSKDNRSSKIQKSIQSISKIKEKIGKKQKQLSYEKTKKFSPKSSNQSFLHSRQKLALTLRRKNQQKLLKNSLKDKIHKMSRKV